MSVIYGNPTAEGVSILKEIHPLAVQVLATCFKLAPCQMGCVCMLTKAATAHTTVFWNPISMNLIGQFGILEERPS